MRYEGFMVVKSLILVFWFVIHVVTQEVTGISEEAAGSSRLLITAMRLHHVIT
jgi:hypothetical protein